MDNIVFKLLLVLGRENPTEWQKAYARDLLRHLDDWRPFMRLAFEKMVAGFVCENLQRLGGVDPLILEEWKKLYRLVALNALRVRAEMELFHHFCLEPSQAGYVFFTGPALAEQFYQIPSQRPSRDLDVLVHGDDFEQVFWAALEQGYRVIVSDGSEPEFPNQATCLALLKYNAVIHFCSPRGVHVEMHRHLDNKIALFDSAELIRCAEPLLVGERVINVLPVQTLLCYVCYHNSRHVWSHLHWLSDLDAILRSEAFDREAALAQARSKGLEQLVQACLEMHALAAAPWSWTEADFQTPGGVLLSMCERNLAGGLEVEDEVRSSFGWRSVPFKEFLSPTMQRRLRWHQGIDRIHPTIREYLEWPLPERWHFMYYFTRLVWRFRIHVLKST